MDAIAKQSKIVDILKGWLPILVVTYHTSLGIGSCFDCPSSFMRVFFCILGQVAVPMFFIISGYYFFTRIEEWHWNTWGRKMKKRMKTLLVPLVLWIVIDFLAKYVFGVLQSEVSVFDFSSLKSFFVSSGGLRIFYDSPVQAFEKSVFGYWIPLCRPIDGPLWYVIMCLTPVIWFFLKNTHKWGLFLLAVLYVLFVEIPVSGFSMTALFFFFNRSFFQDLWKDLSAGILKI